MKECYKCKEILPETIEYFSKRYDGDGRLRGVCRECMRKYAREYQRDNPKTKTSHRKYHLKSKFGISLNEYDGMYNKQNGCCGICGRHQIEIKQTLDVDHNHKTGDVRGLLCNRCNRGLCVFADNVDLLEKAIKYLKDKNEAI